MHPQPLILAILYQSVVSDDTIDCNFQYIIRKMQAFSLTYLNIHIRKTKLNINVVEFENCSLAIVDFDKIVI